MVIPEECLEDCCRLILFWVLAWGKSWEIWKDFRDEDCCCFDEYACNTKILVFNMWYCIVEINHLFYKPHKLTNIRKRVNIGFLKFIDKIGKILR